MAAFTTAATARSVRVRCHPPDRRKPRRSWPAALEVWPPRAATGDRRVGEVCHPAVRATAEGTVGPWLSRGGMRASAVLDDSTAAPPGSKVPWRQDGWAFAASFQGGPTRRPWTLPLPKKGQVGGGPSPSLCRSSVAESKRCCSGEDGFSSGRGFLSHSVVDDDNEKNQNMTRGWFMECVLPPHG